LIVKLRNKAVINCYVEIKKRIFFNSGFVYDFDNILFGIQKQMSASEKKPTKDYLKDNGGIRVYRDNFRIFFFCRAKLNFFFQNLTLGYMTKTLNQIKKFLNIYLVFMSNLLILFLIVIHCAIDGEKNAH
jgi:hypothetical protein